MRAGKKVLLANKEALVMAGELSWPPWRRGSILLPVDSEHNAIFQSLPANFGRGSPPAACAASSFHRVRRTLPPHAHRRPGGGHAGSGLQPTRTGSWAARFPSILATMMNKGPEVIEARIGFACPPEKIQVVVHPQSVIHSLVDYEDGSILAQLGNPDTRTPIAHRPGLSGSVIDPASNPRSLSSGRVRLDFESPDFERASCL